MKKVKRFLVSAFLALALLCGIYWLFWLFNPARHYQAMGEWGREFGYYAFATEQLSKAIHLNATNAGAFNSRGVSRYNQGKYEESIKDYDRAIELDPQYALAIKNRAVAFLFLGKAEEAKQGFTLACKLGRCDDFGSRCSELKLLCDRGECTAFQASLSVGLCQRQ